jgi:hypothetical protein
MKYKHSKEKQKEVLKKYELGGSTGLPEGTQQHFVNYYLGEGTAQGIFAEGGKVGKNTDVILTSNTDDKLTWRGIVTPKVLEDIEEFQYQGDYKRYEIDIYDENLSQKPNKENINKLNGFLNKIGIRFGTVYVYAEDYAMGGSLGNHGLKQGDQIIKTMSGGVQKIKTRSGDIVYVNLANGYRGAEPPLPFKNGGAVKKNLSRDRKFVNYSQDYEVRYSKDKPKRHGYIKPKMSRTQFEDESFEFFADGGGIEYLIFNSENKQKVQEYLKNKKYKEQYREDFDNYYNLKIIEVPYKDFTDYRLVAKYKYAGGGEFMTDPTFGNFQNNVYANGGVTKNYINRNQLNTITIKKGDQKLTYKVSDVYNGAYKLEDGGNLEKTAFYVAKRNVVKVQLRDGRDVKVANGYWIKKGAKPIRASKYDDGGFMADVYATGGVIGKEISFYRHGEEEKGIVGEVNEDGSYNVSTKYSIILVEPQDVISIKDSTKKKGFFFAGGGSIERKYNAMSKEDKEELMESQIGVGRMPFNQYEKFSQLTEHHKKLVERHFRNEAKKMPTGGKTTFDDKATAIPKDLEENLSQLAKWGGTNVNGVIGILNAMIDSGLTNEDLVPKPSKNTLFQIERATDKKIQEIWEKIKPNYKGNFEGNMYYSTLKEMISRNFIYKDVLAEFKPYRKYQKEGVSYAGGGKTSFNDKATAIAKNFEGKKVEPKYQKEYGKTYDKAEAKEVGNKIAGSQKAKYDSKMSGGGNIAKKYNALSKEDKEELMREKVGIGRTPFSEYEKYSQLSSYHKEMVDKHLSTKKMSGGGKTKRGGAMVLAKQIRKDGESWQSALKRANEQVRNK